MYVYTYIYAYTAGAVEAHEDGPRARHRGLEPVQREQLAVRQLEVLARVGRRVDAEVRAEVADALIRLITNYYYYYYYYC